MDQARRLIGDHGVRGFKFQPTVQGFDPSDPAFFPLYAVLQEAGVVSLFHTGQTGIGAGLPGAADCGCATPTPCSSTRSRRSSPSCRS